MQEGSGKTMKEPKRNGERGLFLACLGVIFLMSFQLSPTEFVHSMRRILCACALLQVFNWLRVKR